jgi:hypothetical protein
MPGRIGLLGLIVAGSIVATGLVALAADEIHEGKVVSVTKDTIVVLDNRDGDNDKFVVNTETKVTRDGKPAKLADILAGDRAKVVAAASGEKLVAKSIDARSPE